MKVHSEPGSGSQSSTLGLQESNKEEFGMGFDCLGRIRGKNEESEQEESPQVSGLLKLDLWSAV